MPESFKTGVSIIPPSNFTIRQWAKEETQFEYFIVVTDTSDFTEYPVHCNKDTLVDKIRHYQKAGMQRVQSVWRKDGLKECNFDGWEIKRGHREEVAVAESEKFDIDIDSVLGSRLVFETSSLLGDKMRKLLAMRGLDFAGTSNEIVTYLDKRGILSPENRGRVGDQLAGELHAFSAEGLSLKTFAFGLQVLGFDKLRVDIALSDEIGLPIMMSSQDIKLK